MIELRAGSATCTIDADDGGRLATLRAGDTDLLVAPDPALPPTGWGSFPMVPWAGRVRHGRFTFDGLPHQLPINFGAHAIHGTGFEQAWDVVNHDEASAALRCALRWELGGEAEQRIILEAQSVTCALTARAGDAAMPATIGWHPWFVKPRDHDLRFTEMYLRDDDYIPDGRTVSPPPPPPWDDCFAGPLAPPRLWIDDVEVTIESDCAFWVVYDMPAYATCVEPQSGPPDAFNLDRFTRLEPGHEMTRTMRITWRDVGAGGHGV